MSIIDPQDYFVVKKALREVTIPPMGGSKKVNCKVSDYMHEGRIYQLLARDVEFGACKIILPSPADIQTGMPLLPAISLDLSQLETRIVSKEYVDAINSAYTKELDNREQQRIKQAEATLSKLIGRLTNEEEAHQLDS